MEIEAVVEEGGILHVSLPVGTPVRVTPKKLADYTQKEWEDLVDAISGSIPDLEEPEDDYSKPILALDSEYRP